jgi:membrane-bound lytic murein transglycosylase B
MRRLGLLAAATAALIAAPGAQAATPQQVADEIVANDAALRAAIDDWRAAVGDPPGGQAPDSVMTPSLKLQERSRFLAKRSGLAEQVIALLPGTLAAQVREFTAAARKLRRLSGGGPPRKLRVGKPLPLADLAALYEDAERRYGVASHYLAAINLVETKFGRVKSKSTAGAKGPMQFIPSTWRIYGQGGNIQNPAHAIPAAARLLRANGAPGSYSRALYAYNPSKLYVDAVSRFARQIAADRYAIHFLYCWGP